MKSYMLINPRAGLLKGLTDPAEIKAKLAGLELDPEITLAHDGPGIKAFIKKVRAHKGAVVLVAGGDGTVATVIKGLRDADVTFGLIPTGSTNNIGQSLGLGDELDGYIKVINKAKVAPMDLGMVNGNVFVESVGIGLLAQIMSRVGEQDSKKEVLKVITNTVAEVTTADIIPVHAVIDDKRELVLSTIWLTVTNTGRAAAALVDPSSSVHDEKFELVYCEPINGPEIARYVVAFARNSHIREDKFHRLRAKKLVFTLPPGIETHVDGELKKWKKVAIEVLPAAIQVYVP